MNEDVTRAADAPRPKNTRRGSGDPRRVVPIPVGRRSLHSHRRTSRRSLPHDRSSRPARRYSRNSRRGPVVANEEPTCAARAVGSRPVIPRQSPPGEPSKHRNRTGPDRTKRACRNYRLFPPLDPWGIDPNRCRPTREADSPNRGREFPVSARTRSPVAPDAASVPDPRVRSKASARRVAAVPPRSPCAAR